MIFSYSAKKFILLTLFQMKNNQGVDYSHNMPPAKIVICSPKPLIGCVGLLANEMAGNQYHSACSYILGDYIKAREVFTRAFGHTYG